MISSLTGLRFFLAAMVVVYHYTHFQPLSGPPYLLGIVNSGFAAVSGFFVLSGFVLARNYITADGRLRGTLRDFWGARFARIYPVYFLSLILVFQSFWMSQTHSTAEKAIATLATFTGTQAWIPQTALAFTSVAWSLSVEGFLYVCFPLFIPLVGGSAALCRSTRRLVFIATACALTSLVPPAALWMLTTRSPSAEVISLVRYNPLFHLPAFLAGMVSERLSRSIRAPAWTVWPAVGLILWALSAGRVISYEFLNNGVLIVPFSALILGLAGGDGILSRLLSNRIVVRGGEASYSLYLLHLPLRPWILSLNDALLHLDVSSWLFISTGFALCVTVSLVSFQFVEEPYRRSIRAALRNAPPTAQERTLLARDSTTESIMLKL